MTQPPSLDEIRQRILASRQDPGHLPPNPDNQVFVDQLGQIIAGPVAAGLAQMAGRVVSRIPQKTFA